MNTKEINLSAEDLFNLITEKKILRNGFKIKSESTFLGVLSLLSDKITERLTDDRTSS